jgi:hypothetical protein
MFGGERPAYPCVSFRHLCRSAASKLVRNFKQPSGGATGFLPGIQSLKTPFRATAPICLVKTVSARHINIFLN